MGKCLLDLPNELLETILFYLISPSWEHDVCNFLSFTSTCRYLNQFVHDQRFWQIMAKHRDPICDNPLNNSTWFDYCKEIYWQRIIPGNKLNESISRYDDNYHCTIQKISIWPNKIRVYIDERGDNSLGLIQNPASSIITVTDYPIVIHERRYGIQNNNRHFSIADPRSQYLGYLDFPYRISLDSIGKIVSFQYGGVGYANATLFCFDTSFIRKYNLMDLLKYAEHH